MTKIRELAMDSLEGTKDNKLKFDELRGLV